MDARLTTRPPANGSLAVLVCSKCSKKLGGGFGPKGKTSLARALRGALGLKKGRRATMGIVEVKCLGVCPRGRVTVVNGAQPGLWKLIDAGMPIDAVTGALGLTGD